MAGSYSRRKLDLSDTAKLLAHFWSKVARCAHGPHCDKCCWLWQATISAGYGSLAIHRKSIKAHRLIYLLTYGEILPGLYVCHRCDVKLCVNPQHLWLGTPQENARDAMEKGRARLPTSEGQKKLFEEHPEYIPRGERASGAKLTEAQVLDIRQAYRHTRSPSMLAIQFGVNRATINSIVYRLTWRHLPEE